MKSGDLNKIILFFVLFKREKKTMITFRYNNQQGNN